MIEGQVEIKMNFEPMLAELLDVKLGEMLEQTTSDFDIPLSSSSSHLVNGVVHGDCGKGCWHHVSGEGRPDSLDLSSSSLETCLQEGGSTLGFGNPEEDEMAAREEESGRFFGLSDWGKLGQGADEREEDQKGEGNDGGGSRTCKDSGAQRFGDRKRVQVRGGKTAALGERDLSHQQHSFSFSKPPSSGGRHRQARRRTNHHHHGRSDGSALSRLSRSCRKLLSESLCPWCLTYVRMVVELIVLVAHHCGEVVEGAGVALYLSGGRLLCKATDLSAVKAEACHLLHRVTSAGVTFATWTTKMAAHGYGIWLFFLRVLKFALLLGTGWVRGFLGKVVSERNCRWWDSLWCSTAWAWMVKIWGKAQTAMGRTGLPEPPFIPKPPNDSGRSYPEHELERLLALAEVPEDQLDPFVVLGVEADATDPELKRAYRQLAVLVHPDKNKHPSAGEAFKVLRAAWDIVSCPEMRREYQMKRMAETELSKSMKEFLTKLQDDLKEAMNAMLCTRCKGKHRRFEMERDPSQARFCAECNKHHGVEDGDLWAESSMLGLRITYFAFIDGKVYDITEWAGCQRIGISPDTHRVPYHISFSSKHATGATRQKASSEPPPGPSSPGDFWDFCSRIFQGTVPNGTTNGGGYQPNGSNTSFPTSASQTGPFGPGGPRAEGPKPSRRRKKVRRPFQH
ncbi:dnaJ homolog subfamily C member 14-like [Brienomyrus brachyistius]|uniref:dnaJ homolog subfamily C member 14-like n=1 Tax=Brienomyrus brachyistius TaxID=42636 RepID=UPI0020B292E4|nr:dnaJ homolog subfamily C member 14-like [Brienomyrus brachyistius]XP_048872506.1 dnaJ homolog subfamily C member 14-like [Brienomyrus brachyistius]